MASLKQWRNSFKIHAGFFKISVYHVSGKFKPSAKLTIRQILPVGGVIVVDFFRMQIVTVGWMVG